MMRSMTMRDETLMPLPPFLGRGEGGLLDPVDEKKKEKNKSEDFVFSLFLRSHASAHYPHVTQRGRS
jgi:hypothetical protein